MADTAVTPGSDAGVVRVHGTGKAVAFTSDVNPRYCRANPERGGAQAVAEAYRNLTATGARPLATTDNLNFGNPEKPEIMGQLVGCIKGIGAACAALDVPIVSGNVSLYNETDGRAILPTPTIGAVGLLSSIDDAISMAAGDGDALYLVGATAGHLGQSAVLADLFGREDGDAPPVDLAAERSAGEFVRDANAAELVSAAHDLADGGLALAAAEMALAAGLGVALDAAPRDLTAIQWFFSEDQARYLITCAPADAARLEALAAEAAVPLCRVGTVGGREVRLGGAAVALTRLAEAHGQGLAILLD
jgi:phosphoribosylformylglycinamidine synthase